MYKRQDLAQDLAGPVGAEVFPGLDVDRLRVAGYDRHPGAGGGDSDLVTEAEDQMCIRDRSWFGVTDAEEHFLGVIQRETAEAVPVNERKAISVSDLIETGTSQYRIEENAYLESLLGNPDMRRFGALFVTDVEGRLSGVITVEQLGMALRA